MSRKTHVYVLHVYKNLNEYLPNFSPHDVYLPGTRLLNPKVYTLDIYLYLMQM